MPILTTAITTFILLVLIGIVVGIFMNRGGRSWLGRRVAEATGIGDVTYALVGIAGSFMGFHIGVILELLPSLLLYIAAIAGAFLTIILWRRA
ncbi:transglycosylase [Hyphomicrobium sp.]|uniref:transglycosylase n=1 Tax=Hyphomicrobium sp. TaxID=82 RepID=UPI000FA6841B|nr:transglycosylase [Hyphomicrobium sp.]RUP00527.1 MAG: transglycosylase [Hyphomicrobium sp.]